MDTVLRSLSAFSVLFLSSGLRLQPSTSNSPLRFRARHDIGPTWEQWRWESEGFERIVIPSNQNINATAFKQCAHWSSPPSNQFDTMLDKEMTYNHMLLADHIYFICVQCDSHKFPNNWKGNISIVDGIEADKCLRQQGMDHYSKVTGVHKLIAWAAKDQNFRTAMVLEEDFTLPRVLHRSNTTNHTALAQFINSGAWDFLRFGHMPWQFLEHNGQCTETCLCARESLSRDVCTPAIGCDIRSSVAYMIALRESIVDQLVEAHAVIDNGLLQQFRQSYIVPAMVHSNGHYYQWEVSRDTSFRNHCLTD